MRDERRSLILPNARDEYRMKIHLAKVHLRFRLVVWVSL